MRAHPTTWLCLVFSVASRTETARHLQQQLKYTVHTAVDAWTRTQTTQKRLLSSKSAAAPHSCRACCLSCCSVQSRHSHSSWGSFTLQTTSGSFHRCAHLLGYTSTQLSTCHSTTLITAQQRPAGVIARVAEAIMCPDSRAHGSPCPQHAFSTFGLACCLDVSVEAVCLHPPVSVPVQRCSGSSSCADGDASRCLVLSVCCDTPTPLLCVCAVCCVFCVCCAMCSVCWHGRSHWTTSTSLSCRRG